MVTKIPYTCKKLAVRGESSVSGWGGVTAMSGISDITQRYHWLCFAKPRSIVTQSTVGLQPPPLSSTVGGFSS